MRALLLASDREPAWWEIDKRFYILRRPGARMRSITGFLYPADDVEDYRLRAETPAGTLVYRRTT